LVAIGATQSLPFVALYLQRAQAISEQTCAVQLLLAHSHWLLRHCPADEHGLPAACLPTQEFELQTFAPSRQRSLVASVQVSKQTFDATSQARPAGQGVEASQPQIPGSTSLGLVGSRRAQAASDVGVAAQAPSLLQNGASLPQTLGSSLQGRQACDTVPSQTGAVPVHGPWSQLTHSVPAQIVPLAQPAQAHCPSLHAVPSPQA
jgi:hypothetical protein